MDILIIVLILILIFVVVANLSKIHFPTTDEIIKETGQIGEKVVNYYLKDVEAEGKIINNLYIPTVQGNTTEIDTVFLTRDAIFVIESKNINGIIRGDEIDEKWVSIREDRIQEFRNPIKQNATHAKYLKKQLRQLIPVYSIIAFNDEANLLGIKIDNRHIKVIHYSELADTIDEELKDDLHFINEGEYQVLYNKLKKFSEVSDEVKKKHDNYIKEHYK